MQLCSPPCRKKEFPCSSMPKKGPDFTQSTHLDFELNETRGLLIMWTAFIQEELANMTELTDREKNPMLLVCLKDEIKESENTEFSEINTTETCLSSPLRPPSSELVALFPIL